MSYYLTNLLVFLTISKTMRLILKPCIYYQDPGLQALLGLSLNSKQH